MAPKPYLGNCEPNFYIPQRIDIKALREELFPQVKIFEEKSTREELIRKQPELIDSKILPVFEKYSDYIKEMLSLKRNEYLRLKYDRFLDSPAEKVVEIRLFSELKQTRPVPKPKSLTGCFYDINNKLAPIPYMPDARNSGNKPIQRTSDTKKLSK